MDPSRELNPPAENPYIGPRPYELNEKDRFHGRDRESRDLLSLVLSERLVLFYAQSGAGKTSLINTRLIPGLNDAGFEVPLVGRVSGELLPGVQVANIFTTNLMIKLDEGSDDPQRFDDLPLSEFLLNLYGVKVKGEKEAEIRFYYRPPGSPSPDESAAQPAAGEAASAETSPEAQLLPRALIIDQFEELFTTHPEAWMQRKDFLQQLVEAMEADPYLWVVLAMREDHIAELDPYTGLFPNRLATRYYMQRMGEKAAFDAVILPVKELRPFEDQAASLLVENLGRISAGKDEKGQPRFVEGEFVEPVQLQVVCYQLWEALKNQPGEHITLGDLQRLARGQDLAQFVNQALADYYQDTLKKALHQPQIRVSEGKLREWFSEQLITEAGTRGFVYMGEQRTAGIPNPVVQFLDGKLVRGESRAGGRWYELVHDRFIDPILLANRQWSQRRQRKFVIRGGVGLSALIIISLCLFFSLSTLFARSSRQSQATQFAQTAQSTLVVAQQNAESAATDQYLAEQSAIAAAYGLETAAAEATLSSARLQVLQGAKSNLQATQAEAASTSTAEAVESTRQAIEALLTANPTAETSSVAPSSTPTAGLFTPTPSPSGTPPTPTPTPKFTRPSVTPTPDEISRAATASALMIQLENLNATQTAQANPVQQLVIGYSHRGAEIKVTTLGTGTRNVVLVGGLTGGYAKSSSDLAKLLRDYFQTNIHLIPKEVKLHIVHNANPDSPAGPGSIGGRLNASDVDLNRNWDCNWAQDTMFSTFPVSGGSKPFSEPETQALRDYFMQMQPVVVIVWDATYSEIGRVTPGGCGSTSLFSDWLAMKFARETGYVLGDVASKDTGDAANWLDEQGFSAIRVRLPYLEFTTREESKTALDDNVRAIREIMNYFKSSQLRVLPIMPILPSPGGGGMNYPIGTP